MVFSYSHSGKEQIDLFNLKVKEKNAYNNNIPIFF